MIDFTTKTREELLQRIEELKRNTFPNKQLIEELENMNSTRHKSRDGETHRELVFPKDAVLNRIALAEKLKKEYLDKMYFNNPDLMTQKEFEEAVKKDTVDKEAICEENCVIYNPSNLFGGKKESQTVSKAPIFTFCKQMKNAMEQLAFRSEYGHNKYLEFDADWNNFARVENGDEQYANAEFRHALGIGEDTELEHYVASAWNAVARLEIYLRKLKNS
jgi:hypothetical protein